ncbi:hypothetical protein IKS57_03035 [bacterium]|nr:hypothetical protein [bacterium]
MFEKANNEIIDKLIKDISNLFNDETIYSDNFLTSLDFDFFIKNKKNEQYLVYLKNILVLFDNFLIKENEELFKKSHIINKLNHIFIKLNQCIELKNLFNEEEKSLFNTVRNKIDDATKNNLNSKNPNKKLVNKNISHQQKQINNQNSILKKIEELFLNLSSLFKTLDVNNINPELKKSIIEYFSSVSINNFCSQISFEEIIRSFNEVKDLKSKLKDDFMLLIDINNLSLISNIPYVLLLPSFTRFEVLISQLLISKKICKIEKNDSMISRINEIVNYLDKKNNLLKTKYTAFFKFLKFCFYDTDGFNLRNIYNHEENCEQKYCLNLDKNNTSKFLIALLLYLLNLSI